jgi:hypothetical protein
MQIDLPHTDLYGLNKLHTMVHCDPCSKLKASLIKTDDHITHITTELRTASDPAAIEKLRGSLKAHFTGKQRIRKKLDDRLPASRPTGGQKQLDPKADGQLPW